VQLSQGGVGDEGLGYGPGPISPNIVTYNTCHDEITPPSSLTMEMQLRQGCVGDEGLGYGPGPIIPKIFV